MPSQFEGVDDDASRGLPLRVADVGAYLDLHQLERFLNAPPLTVACADRLAQRGVTKNHCENSVEF